MAIPTPVHRDADSRSCGATTIVSGQKTVWANNLLVSVNGDENTHGSGRLVASCNNVYVENEMVVVEGNDSNADNRCAPLGGDHCNPKATSGSPDVFVGV